jgi:DNA repair exonuclease SbcCD ATPase subunit
MGIALSGCGAADRSKKQGAQNNVTVLTSARTQDTKPGGTTVATSAGLRNVLSTIEEDYAAVGAMWQELQSDRARIEEERASLGAAQDQIDLACRNSTQTEERRLAALQKSLDARETQLHGDEANYRAKSAEYSKRIAEIGTKWRRISAENTAPASP